VPSTVRLYTIDAGFFVFLTCLCDLDLDVAFVQTCILQGAEYRYRMKRVGITHVSQDVCDDCLSLIHRIYCNKVYEVIKSFVVVLAPNFENKVIQAGALVDTADQFIC